MRITTVGEFKKYLNNFNDDNKVVFADRELLPCKPYVWEMNKVETFINEKISKSFHEQTYKDMKSMKITDSDLVIHARF